jgi:hypothetical protein
MLVGCTGAAGRSRVAPTTSTPSTARSIQPSPSTTGHQVSVIWSQTGSVDATTAPVSIPAGDWQLRWSYDCTAHPNGGFLYVSTFSQASALLHELDLEGKQPTSGVASYHDQAGSYNFEINTNCHWSLQVAT